jgi:hypothetical protein
MGISVGQYPPAPNAVADWDTIAVQAILAANPPHPGPTGFLDMAVVHAAVCDTVESFDGRFQPYHLKVPGASGSPSADRRQGRPTHG